MNTRWRLRWRCGCDVLRRRSVSGSGESVKRKKKYKSTAVSLFPLISISCSPRPHLMTSHPNPLRGRRQGDEGPSIPLSEREAESRTYGTCSRASEAAGERLNCFFRAHKSPPYVRETTARTSGRALTRFSHLREKSTRAPGRTLVHTRRGHFAS